MRFNRGSIMAPIGSPTKMTGRDQMSIGGLGGGMDFDTSQFLTKSDLPTFDTSQFLTKSDMPTAFDPSQLEQQIGGLQKQIGNIPSYDDTNIRNMIGNIPQFDDSAIRRMIEDNQRSIGNIPSFDPSSLQSQIEANKNLLSNIPQFDDSALRQMIEQNKNRPGFDASGLQSQIGGIEDRLSNLPQFDPSNLQSGIAGLTDRLDNLNIPEYKAPDLSGFARKEDIPSFDRNALRDELFKDITGSIKVPEAPIFDRDALIRDIRSGIDIPKPPSFDRDALIEDIRGGINIPSFDREKLIEDIRGGINIPQAPAFDRQKLIEDIRGGINIPQAPDLSAFDTRFADMQKRIDELSQRQAPPQNENQLKPEDYMGRKNFVGRPPQPVLQLDPLGRSISPVAQNIDITGGLGDFVPPPGYKEGPTEGGPAERPGGPISIRPDLLPPKRGDFMSIGGPGGIGATPDTGMLDPNTRIGNYGLDRQIGGQPLQATPAPSTGKMPSQATLDALEELRKNPGPSIPIGFGSYGPGGNLEIPKGGYLSDLYNPGLPKPGVGNNPPQAPTDDMARLPGPPLQATPAPVQPAPTEPAAVAPTAGADPTQTQMPMGAIDPVLLQQATSETLTDPLIRSLYFGTQDSPGFYQQLQQAGANLIGSDVPLQQTAGLSPLELLARQKAVAGLGGFEPFLQQNRDLVDQAIAQSRRAEELQDPYYTQAEEIYKDTMGAYDPSMTQQFYNPYEDAVVQKTIQDVMEAGDKQDIASRAREISSGAFGGSRARLGAEERRESLGEGLAQALGNIRSQGFQSAQATGLGEFARQQAAKRTGAQGLMGIGVGRGSAASQLGSQLAGYGSQIGGIGQTQEQMRAGQRGELSGYGGIGRGIAETGLGRIFEQQVGQQYRPMQTLGQIGSMLPGYQASGTKIDSQYGMPTDPSAAGLGAAFSAYGALAPRQGQT